MFSAYLPLFLMVAVAIVVALVLWSAATFLGPKNPTPEKLTPYESGADSTGTQGVRPSVKFYVAAILFVIFDVEAVFLYPWASVFRELGWLGLAEMLTFLVVLGVTLAYAWKKGALEWVK
ncbi:MAG: NADH-quinone oxidoreductase subunit A [Myxococcales bacterium]|jgi:NADH-quinone oxidoreductase subunit A|nr:NADH-quinone oxidoreductase subunit A [Myxococcales bacterium]